MTFKQAFESLPEAKQIKLTNLLLRWNNYHSTEVRQLWYESALDDGSLNYLIIKLLELAKYNSITHIRQQLRNQFSWLQLSGKEYKARHHNVQHFVAVIPFNRLRNYFLEHYGHTYFKRSQQVENLLSELHRQSKAKSLQDYIRSNGLGNIGIREDSALTWFHWDPQKQVKDIFELLDSRSRVLEALKVPDRFRSHGRMIVFSFNYDQATNSNHDLGWQLYRPTAIDADLNSGYETVPSHLGVADYGITNEQYEIKGYNLRIAEAVSRSGTIRLRSVEKLKII